jgi:hypothetical protein
MAYAYYGSTNLGSTYAAATITATVVDATGAALGTQPTRTVVSLGGGCFGVAIANMPAGHVGWVVLKEGSVVLDVLPVSPAEVEVMNANLVSVDGLATADGSAVLRLRRIEVANDTEEPAFAVTNSAGTAMALASTGGNGLDVGGEYAGAWFHGTADYASGLDVLGGLNGFGATFQGQLAPGLKVISSDAPAVVLEIADTGGGGGHGLAIAAAGAGNHDIALLGSGDILGDLAGDVTGSVALAATGLDAIPMTLAGAPSSFRDWFVWLTLRFRKVRRVKGTGILTVYGPDATTVVTTQATTDTDIEQTTGPPT